jgi:hypothetical protein
MTARTVPLMPHLAPARAVALVHPHLLDLELLVAFHHAAGTRITAV